MTLWELTKIIDVVAAAQPAVHSVIPRDVFLLNNERRARYGVFCAVQRQHTLTLGSDFVTYGFYLYYIDRLLPDKTNTTEVQSVGIETLRNICEQLREVGVDFSELTITPFTERFADECAGVFASVEISVEAGSLCGENWINLLTNLNMYTLSITGEQPFQVNANNAIISASGQGYTLYQSVDGTTFAPVKDYDDTNVQVAADRIFNLVDVAKGTYYKLVGNTDTIYITF